MINLILISTIHFLQGYHKAPQQQAYQQQPVQDHRQPHQYQQQAAHVQKQVGLAKKIRVNHFTGDQSSWVNVMTDSDIYVRGVL